MTEGTRPEAPAIPGEPAGCDAAEWGGAPTVLDGQCRCMVCGRCGHHTGNAHQGHHWNMCSVTHAMREPHFCCPDPEFGCELESAAPGPLVLPPDEYEAVRKVASMLGMDRPAPALGERSAASMEADMALPDEPHINLLESAWGVIANAGWDDCAKTPGWQGAAERWRDDYHRWLDLHLRPGGYQTWEELAGSLVRERDALFAEAASLRRALRDAAGSEAVLCPGCLHDGVLERTLERAEAAEAKLAAIAEHVRLRMNSPGRSGMTLAAAGLILGIAEGGSEEGSS